MTPQASPSPNQKIKVLHIGRKYHARRGSRSTDASKEVTAPEGVAVISPKKGKAFAKAPTPCMNLVAARCQV
jgi:hypothetical protein